jgi:hypothetical protein
MIIRNHKINLKDTSPAEMARLRQIILGIWRQQVEDEKNAVELLQNAENSQINNPANLTAITKENEISSHNSTIPQVTSSQNNTIVSDDLDDMAPAIERPNSYNGVLGKGDWREDDRITNNLVWQNANHFNLQQKNGEYAYKTIEERAGFYKWFQKTTELRGYETKWAGAAFVVAAQMSNIHSINSSLIDNDVESDIKAFAESGNKDIFNNFFKKLRDLYNGPVLKGQTAKNWDTVTLTVEQRDIVGPTYFKYQRLNPKIIQVLSKMAKGQGLFGIGVSPELRFDEHKDIMDWKNRFNHGMTVAVPFWNKYYSKK